MKKLLYKLLLLLVLYLPFGLHAEVVQTMLPSGITVTADYREVPESRATLLIVHGFLATRHFRTVANLTNALFDEGYSVLAPTLSLGVNRRQVSLACEAVHTHSIEDDVAEIDFWVKWLKKRGRRNIVLVGHSYGSHEILMYTMKHPKSNIRRVIATSLVDVGMKMGISKAQAQFARASTHVDNGKNPLGEYHLSYCKRYVSPAKAFLSYASWDKLKILAAFRKINVPVDVILGGDDKRVDLRWMKQLKKKGVRYTLIPGANHFFDAEHEFNLLEHILVSLKAVK